MIFVEIKDHRGTPLRFLSTSRLEIDGRSYAYTAVHGGPADEAVVKGAGGMMWGEFVQKDVQAGSKMSFLLLGKTLQIVCDGVGCRFEVEKLSDQTV